MLSYSWSVLYAFSLQIARLKTGFNHDICRLKTHTAEIYHCWTFYMFILGGIVSRTPKEQSHLCSHGVQKNNTVPPSQYNGIFLLNIFLSSIIINRNVIYIYEPFNHCLSVVFFINQQIVI